MKASELRLGNIVQGMQVTVVRSLSEREINGWNCGSFSGIPLTEEVLLKCGFSDKNYKKGYIGIDFECVGMYFDFVLCKPKQKGTQNNCYTYDLEDFRYVEISHVHQLQNMFYVITGKELGVKL